jgi:cytochrome c oxidase assembly protein subunit 15
LPAAARVKPRQLSILAVVDTVLARARLREVSALRFAQLALVSLAALFLVVASGAFVRLTGSGLGCENWPLCGDKPYPEQGYHAFVEFGNRLVALTGIGLTLVTWLAARRVRGLSRRVRLAALAAFLGTVAQIPLGGITIMLDLHPLAVMAHFILALLVVALATVVALESWTHLRGLAAPIGPTWWRLLVTAGIPVTLALVVTGAVVTASGPHPGGDEVRRLGISIVDAVWVHVRVTAVYGVGLLVIGSWLVRQREAARGVTRLALVLLAVLLTQMAVGEIQYRNALPWGLVLVHVCLAATIWTLSIAIAWSVWRPPAPLVGAGSRTAEPGSA